MSDNFIHALSGAGGGAISMFLTYPLLNISSRLQVQGSTEDTEKFSGNVDAFKKLIDKHGFAALYYGVESAVLGNAVSNGVYYFFFEFSRKAFLKVSTSNNLNTVESLLAGAFAGAMTAIITNPIWVVNTRVATKKSDDPKAPRTSALAELRNIIKQEGFFSLWRGIKPALILVINPIIQYTIFEQLKNEFQQFRILGNLDYFLLGAVSKLAATAVTYPYILIKAQMQIKKSEQEDFNSVLDGFRWIISSKGVGGLYSGIESRLLQSVLTAAILFMTKESLYKLTVRLVTFIAAKRAKPSY
ncbi:hypothetical protein BB560_004606 [Smittium megazygosporum]|uniref:Peroxisomal membrane protein PMP47B n=1 Tax=Smittium megazygosporum TaxID=133381 RepID=A0A2T9Z8T3_9FUNG|nr:hypothetical protein BB560_004606 [Smittium megazygosporum]